MYRTAFNCRIKHNNALEFESRRDFFFSCPFCTILNVAPTVLSCFYRFLAIYSLIQEVLLHLSTPGFIGGIFQSCSFNASFSTPYPVFIPPPLTLILTLLSFFLFLESVITILFLFWTWFGFFQKRMDLPPCKIETKGMERTRLRKSWMGSFPYVGS